MINEIQAHKYCRDDISKIENYNKAVNDTTQTWVIHHRLELTLDGEFALTPEQLMMHDMYFNRPYYELIFLTRSEHMHIPNYGSTDIVRQRISKKLKGRTFTAESRRKMSEAAKNRVVSDETRKKLSDAHKGEKNHNYGKHFSEEHCRKISESHKSEKNPMYGKHLSAASSKKKSESMKAYWRRRKLELSDKEDEDTSK